MEFPTIVQSLHTFLVCYQTATIYTIPTKIPRITFCVRLNIKNPLNIRNIGAVKVRDANNAETFGKNCACNTQLNWPQGFLTKFVFLKTLGRGFLTKFVFSKTPGRGLAFWCLTER